jgi:hypothetical protein
MILSHLSRHNQLFLVICIIIPLSANAGSGYPFDILDNNYQEAQNSKVVTYQYPRISPSATNFSFKANGEKVFVYNTSAGPFAAFSCEGEVKLEIELPEAYRNVTVSPARHGIVPEVDGKKIRFDIPGPILLAVMVDGLPELYIYANPLETNKPDPNDPLVKYFKAGQVYEIGQLRLQDNETLYVEGGAIVRGSVIATNAENVRIAGYGVLDGSYYIPPQRSRSIIYEGCRNSRIENIIMIEPSSWMIVLGRSEHIIVRDVKQLGSISTSDGVDIVGSRHIRVENSFLRNGDDCIAIKSFDMGRYERAVSMDLTNDVEDVEVRGCIMIVFLGGKAFEIGHELTTNSINNIRFIDCDVLGAHGHSSVFGISNADGALVSNVLYENIRVEHYYSKLVDLRVIESRFGRDDRRGQIRNVTFRNIDVTVSRYNPGYSISLIGGLDADHTVENVLFDNFRLNGVKVTNADQLDLFIKQAREIEFR